MADGISDYAVDAGSDVELLNAVYTAQLRSGDLSWGGFLTAGGRAESEGAASAHSQDPADESLLAHTPTDHWMAVALAGEEANHRDVVGQGGGGAHDLVEVGGIGQQFLEGFFQLFGAPKIMEGEDQSGSGAEFLELFRLAFAGSLKLDVDQLTSRSSGFVENVELGGDSSAEFASAGRPTTCGNGHGAGVGLEEALEMGQCKGRFGKIV